MTGDVGLGDAPESVAGVASIGVVHAPGYVSYTVAARLFTVALPVGGLAWRVNVFSLCCMAVAVFLLTVTVRRCGASRLGGVVGVAAVATSASLWFYAGFAKHNAFSFLLLTGVFAAVVAGTQAAGRWTLGVAGLLAGLSVGAAWYAMALMIPGLG